MLQLHVVYETESTTSMSYRTVYLISYTGEPEQRKATVGNIDLTISMLVSTIMNVWLLRCRAQLVLHITILLPT